MTESAPKFITEFSITEDGKSRLQEFFDRHLTDLQENKNAIGSLVGVLGQVLPPESKEALQDVMRGDSHYAMQIHNLPEKAGMQNSPVAQQQSSYSYHIGNALYRLCDMESHWSTMLSRKVRLPVTNGNYIHRDLQGGEHPNIIFSCPYNADHALTKIIRLTQAIEQIPEEERKRLSVKVIRQNGQHEDCLLEDAYRTLKTNAYPGIRTIAPLESLPELREAIRQNSQSVDIQPGQLLIVSEGGVFHRAHSGSLAPVPDHVHHRRLLVHNAGGKVL